MHNIKFDRTLSFGIIVTLAVQTAGALMWAGAADARLSHVETNIAAHPAISERLARMEAQMDMARASLTRIEHRLDQNQ